MYIWYEETNTIHTIYKLSYNVVVNTNTVNKQANTHINMYIATHTWVTRDIHILAHFIIYHIVIHIKKIMPLQYALSVLTSYYR